MNENSEHVFNEYDMPLVNYYQRRLEQVRKETEARVRKEAEAQIREMEQRMRMKAEQEDRNSFMSMMNKGFSPEEISELVNKPLDYVLKLLESASSES